MNKGQEYGGKDLLPEDPPEDYWPRREVNLVHWGHPLPVLEIVTVRPRHHRPATWRHTLWKCMMNHHHAIEM